MKGPQVTPGYLGQPEARRPPAFDDEGFYVTGDAARLVDPGDPSQGLVFDGRLSENFKLATGTFVARGRPAARRAVSAIGGAVTDAVVCGEGREARGPAALSRPADDARPRSQRGGRARAWRRFNAGGQGLRRAGGARAGAARRAGRRLRRDHRQGLHRPGAGPRPPRRPRSRALFADPPSSDVMVFRMNGADALLATLVANGVTACFANPGTSEMQFVAALDRVPAMRPVLCQFEGVATGAADGYGRIAGKPACTLLHLGPGYGNGVGQPAQRPARLHADRQRDRRPRHLSPPVRRAAELRHRHPGQAQLAVGRSRPTAPTTSAGLAAEAVAASYGPPGGSASLILPADCAWSPATGEGPVIAQRPARPAPADTRSRPPPAIRAAKKPVVLIGGRPAARPAWRRPGACGRRRAGRLPTPSSPARRAAPAPSRPSGCRISARWRWPTWKAST